MSLTTEEILTTIQASFENLVARSPRLPAMLPGTYRQVFTHPIESHGGGFSHELLWDDQRPVAWTLEPERRDAAFVCAAHDLYSWIKGSSAGPCAPAQVIDINRRWRIPLQPSDLRPTASQQPISSLDLMVRVTFPESWWCRAPIDLRFEGGLLQESSSPPLEPDITLELPFPEGFGYLLGSVPFRDIAASSSVGRDVLALACVTGLLAPPDPSTGDVEPLALARATYALGALESWWESARPIDRLRPDHR